MLTYCMIVRKCDYRKIEGERERGGGGGGRGGQGEREIGRE